MRTSEGKHVAVQPPHQVHPGTHSTDTHAPSSVHGQVRWRPDNTGARDLGTRPGGSPTSRPTTGEGTARSHSGSVAARGVNKNKADARENGSDKADAPGSLKERIPKPKYPLALAGQLKIPRNRARRGPDTRPPHGGLRDPAGTPREAGPAHGRPAAPAEGPSGPRTPLRCERLPRRRPRPTRAGPARTDPAFVTVRSWAAGPRPPHFSGPRAAVTSAPHGGGGGAAPGLPAPPTARPPDARRPAAAPPPPPPPRGGQVSAPPPPRPAGARAPPQRPRKLDGSVPETPAAPSPPGYAGGGLGAPRGLQAHPGAASAAARAPMAVPGPTAPDSRCPRRPPGAAAGGRPGRVGGVPTCGPRVRAPRPRRRTGRGGRAALYGADPRRPPVDPSSGVPKAPVPPLRSLGTDSLSPYGSRAPGLAPQGPRRPGLSRAPAAPSTSAAARGRPDSRADTWARARARARPLSRPPYLRDGDGRRRLAGAAAVHARGAGSRGLAASFLPGRLAPRVSGPNNSRARKVSRRGRDGARRAGPGRRAAGAGPRGGRGPGGGAGGGRAPAAAGPREVTPSGRGGGCPRPRRLRARPHPQPGRPAGLTSRPAPSCVTPAAFSKKEKKKPSPERAAANGSRCVRVQSGKKPVCVPAGLRSPHTLGLDPRPGAHVDPGRAERGAPGPSPRGPSGSLGTAPEVTARRTNLSAAKFP
ncbi:basic proline-rich protein-like [Oryctolagus cuniculus]|uniref:basic proline-rich protein-like n=1 Tax=Oryctolagus cuniculus TaxID=9986 RepID=UPI0038799BEA